MKVPTVEQRDRESIFFTAHDVSTALHLPVDTEAKPCHWHANNTDKSEGEVGQSQGFGIRVVSWTDIQIHRAHVFKHRQSFANIEWQESNHDQAPAICSPPATGLVPTPKEEWTLDAAAKFGTILRARHKERQDNPEGHQANYNTCKQTHNNPAFARDVDI